MRTRRPALLVVGALAVLGLLLGLAAPAAALPGAWGRRLLRLTPDGMEVVRLVVAAVGAALLGWGWVLRRRGRPGAWQPLRDRLLLALGLIAALCWWNGLNFHFGTYVHMSDTFHYYVGAKYQRELGYTRLYACTVVAEAESGHATEAEHRRIRDLEQNVIGPAAAVLASPEACTRHFTPARWASFRADVEWFRGHMAARYWARALMDHGYNGTPAWAILGTLLANTGPASGRQILALALIDAALLLGMWALVWRTFGWRAAAVALLFWGTNYPARFFWTGGAYLRQDWLALAVAGICLLRRERPVAAGFLLTYSTLLRLFPGLILAALALHAAVSLAARRSWRPEADHVRLAVGAGLALAVLLPASAVVAGGAGVWSAFIENTRKHADTPLTNHMGLHTVVAFEHASRARLSAPLGLEDDPYLVWKDARRRVFAERRYLFGGLVLAFVALLARALARQPAWAAAALGVGLIPVATELTCYYYSFLLAYGFLGGEDDGRRVGLAGLAAATALIPRLLTWNDEVYTLMSAAVIVFVVAATAASRAAKPSPG